MNTRGNYEVQGFQKGVKRGLDLLISTILLVVLWPFLALIALAIILDSPGGAIYRQIRIGKDGMPFHLYKFRSMIKDCGDNNYLLYLSTLIASERNGSGKKLPYRKMDDDCRVTRVGKVIRRFYIDELPQLINIIKGDMSLVGPRPHVQLEVDNYLPAQRRRLSVPPGVTGMWQVEGKAECTFNQLINLDLYYIDHWNLGLDFKILYETFNVLSHGGEGCLESYSQPVRPWSMEGMVIPITSGPAEQGGDEAAEIEDRLYMPQVDRLNAAKKQSSESIEAF